MCPEFTSNEAVLEELRQICRINHIQIQDCHKDINRSVNLEDFNNVKMINIDYLINCNESRPMFPTNYCYNGVFYEGDGMIIQAGNPIHRYEYQHVFGHNCSGHNPNKVIFIHGKKKYERITRDVNKATALIDMASRTMNGAKFALWCIWNYRLASCTGNSLPKVTEALVHLGFPHMTEEDTQFLRNPQTYLNPDTSVEPDDCYMNNISNYIDCLDLDD